jgi:hypothetical protein
MKRVIVASLLLLLAVSSTAQQKYRDVSTYKFVGTTTSDTIVLADDVWRWELYMANATTVEDSVILTLYRTATDSSVIRYPAGAPVIGWYMHLNEAGPQIKGNAGGIAGIQQIGVGSPSGGMRVQVFGGVTTKYVSIIMHHR